ncbi:MAG: hypothetical protein L6Q72_16900 [Burkholderiaceae bacterium]|nr:hypothetical protein [Burkholderiaceae bacterium]GIL05004.1 MAG: hypothetical protein BroJett031_15240 [Betaproteobacteria bacterium]
MADARDLDIAMDAQSLYREEIYTDRKVGTIRVMVPVTTMGATDPARPVLYSGEAQIMTQLGPLPISFEIEAKTLAEAVERYADTAKVAIERTIKELQEMRRQAASGLVIPGAGGGLGGPGGLPPMGRGGGKIQLP